MVSKLFNPLPGIVDKPTLEQARWVAECLVKGWLASCSARGCIEQVMGYDIPGESVSFQDVGFMGFWNALQDVEQKPITPVEWKFNAGRMATIRYTENGKQEKHRMMCSEKEIEADVALEWKKRHPDHSVIHIVFDGGES